MKIQTKELTVKYWSGSRWAEIELKIVAQSRGQLKNTLMHEIVDQISGYPGNTCENGPNILEEYGDQQSRLMKALWDDNKKNIVDGEISLPIVTKNILER